MKKVTMEKDYQYGYYEQEDENYEEDNEYSDSEGDSSSYHNLIPFLTYFIAVLLGGISLYFYSDFYSTKFDLWLFLLIYVTIEIDVVIISGIVLTFICGIMCMAGKQNVCRTMIGYLALISMYLGGIAHLIALPYGVYLLYEYLETRLWLPIAFIVYELLIATFLIFRLFRVCFFEEIDQDQEIKPGQTPDQEMSKGQQSDQTRSRSNSIDQMHQALRWSVLFPGRNMRSISSHVTVGVNQEKQRQRSESFGHNINALQSRKEANENQQDKK